MRIATHHHDQPGLAVFASRVCTVRDAMQGFLSVAPGGSGVAATA